MKPFLWEIIYRIFGFLYLFKFIQNLLEKLLRRVENRKITYKTNKVKINGRWWWALSRPEIISTRNVHMKTGLENSQTKGILALDPWNFFYCGLLLNLIFKCWMQFYCLKSIILNYKNMKTLWKLLKCIYNLIIMDMRMIQEVTYCKFYYH